MTPLAQQFPKIPGYTLVEQLYLGSRTAVYRGVQRSPQCSVVIKTLRHDYPSFSELVQFRNQYAIAKNLNIPGIVQPMSLEPYANGYALVMEDIGGISLRHYIQTSPLTIAQFWPVALQIVDVLHQLYQQRVIHKDIKPANILIQPQTRQIKLIDFSIASLLPRETQEIQNPNVLEGTLTYISPEQTGRMNRGIDYRSDFYSLGITFFELLTGQLPFSSDEPMEMVHAHLAKQPLSVCDLNPDLPIMLGEIIRKLMAKNAEDRYQSALGLKHDLMRCQQEYQVVGKHAWFELGERDISDRFLIPEKLYGREQEVQTLLDAFGRVANGASELMLVAGFSGIGKTAVVNEVHKPIVRWHGYFIKGKYDQFNRNLPFSAFVQAFRDLLGQLLSSDDAQLQEWKAKILAAVGDNGQVLIEVIPELEQVIGLQPPVPELTGSAAQNRFHLLFQKFITVFTTPEHPLVIFLDDLQWADSASLNLLKLLLTERDRGYLFIIGAYRDNEVFPTHPLMLMLDEVKKAATLIHTLTLEPLSQTDVNQLTADTLSCSLELAQPLTELVYQKTKGNPFFLTQFLKALHEDGYISFDSQAGHWQCDLATVRLLALTDDVVEFMALQLQKLPTATQTALKLAACIGAQFDLATLAIVNQRSPEETAIDLWKALQEGVILPITEVYKFYQPSELQVVEVNQVATFNCSYRFLHDRVQQAAYSLIPDEQKQTTHYQIGQLLLFNTTEENREEKIFDLVNQLNYGVELITQPEERERLARLNLAAGTKAKAATAYQAAIEYFMVGRKLLVTDCWRLQYELTLALSESAAEAAYLNSKFEIMEELIEEVLQETRSLLDQINVYEVKLQAYTVKKQFVEAIETAFSVLKLLGVSFPESPTDEDIQREFTLTKSYWSDREIKELIHLPEMKEPEKKAALRILNSIVSPAYIALPQFLPLIACEQAKLLIENGNEPNAAFAYGNYAVMLCVIVGDIESGYQFGQLASGLLSKFNAKEITAKVVLCTDGDIKHWKEPARETIKPLLAAYQTGLETGDIIFATYCAFYGFCNSYFAGTDLRELEQEVASYSQAFRELKQDTVFSWNELHRQGILNLIKPSPDPGCLVGEAYNETKSLPFHQEVNDHLALHILHSHKLILNYLFEKVDEAIENAAIAEKYLDGVTGMFVIPGFYLYDSLARLRSLNNREAANIETQLAKVAANQKKMQIWASHGPMNHLHKFNLIEAEKHRVLEQKLEAIEMYDRAISGAKENGYIQEEALANELAAKFYLEWGKEKIAQTYIQEAYYGYARWGAKAKINDLEKRYPQLLAPILQQEQPSLSVHTTVFATERVSSTSASSTSLSDSLDLVAILKASQTLSSEIELDQLIGTLLLTVMQTSGATQCILMLNDGPNLTVQARAELTKSGQIETQILHPTQSLVESGVVPISLVTKVKRSLQPIVITNAVQEPLLLSDVYVQNQQPKSLLCSPILQQRKLLGMVYLENNLVTGAFTHDRVELLNLLCAQAAISLENARLYQQAQAYAQQLEDSQLQIVQSEKMATLGNLVAGVAHEINNPVGFLNGSINNAKDYIQDLCKYLGTYQQYQPATGPVAELAKKIDLEFLLEDLPKLIDSMQSAADRIKGISTSLRTFSRADKEHKVSANLHEGLNSTLLILKYRLKANEKRPAIKVIRDYGDIPKIDCFPGQLNQVFMNILANAIDMFDEMAQHTTFVELEQHPQQITIQTTFLSEQNSVAIRIGDNGKGINEEAKSKIFDHLFTTKEIGKGTGLGLTIARQIVVEKHGGRLEAQSELGQGTKFTISLPVRG